MRPPASPAGVVGALYGLLRSPDEPPLTYQLAQAIRSAEGSRVLIVTGLVEPHRFPLGEIDGPLGSIALARALTLLGHPVTIVADVEVMPALRGLLDSTPVTGIAVRAGDFATLDEARGFAREFGLVVAIEKLSRNSKGVRHLVWGTPCETGDPYADDYILAAAEAGAVTLAVGDNGNEIGFGKIPPELAGAAPRGQDCGCPCGAGIFAATPCDLVLPASVSNLGCYALTAALAVLSGRADLAVSGDQVRAWIEHGLRAGLRSGGIDDPMFAGDDGIPTRYVAAHAELISGVVAQHQLKTPAPTVAAGATPHP
ncbi:MAG: glutamate cyclase domain-containing protein [Actinocatenispora sp.]